MTHNTSNQANPASAVHAATWPFICAPVGGSAGSLTAPQSDLDMVHSRLGVLSSLYVSLRAKHGPAASHSFRVAMWASCWGISLKLKEEHLQLFETVGLLHEIGKIGIPDRVLQKPEKLTENEHAMMSLHRQVGLEILQAAGASNELLLAIEGVGTRFELSNDAKSLEIAPIASRLINIIDAYDSMVTGQVYRRPLTSEMALAEIFRNSGSQFDPQLVRSFAEVILNPRSDVVENAKNRWLAKIEPSEQRKLFNVDDIDLKNISGRCELAGSALVQTLNGSFYRQMMDHVQNGVIFVDSEYRVLDWNSAASRMTGVAAETVFHQYWSPSFAGLCDSEGFALDETQCPFRELVRTGELVRQRLAIRHDGLDLLHVNLEAVPVFNNDGNFCGGALILEDISETALLEQKIVTLRERACIDELTRVPNRGELNRQLPEFVSYHQRSNCAGSIIICDIDFFKRINDNFSHQIGDEALIVFASVLKESCRSTDFVARYGGEEFVMLCSQCDLTEAKQWAEMIRERLQRTPIASIGNVCMTASFGVSMVLPGDTSESVLGRADQGLLIAKDSGRDRVVGLGSDSKSPDLKKAVGTGRSWFGWGTAIKDVDQKYELVTDVPRIVTLEKLKGFVNEVQAVVIQVESDKVVLEVDCRKMIKAIDKKERLGKFRIEINIVELEMNTACKKGYNKVCTLLEVAINPIRSRDRRNESVICQALRLKIALQGLLVARDMDSGMNENIIRRIKPEKNSRY